MFFLGKVEIVDVYEREVRSVSLVFQVPAVVRLLRYVSLGQRKPPLSRINLLARDKFSCQYCGCSLTQKESTVDHILPRSRGGPTSWENLVIACQPCNRKKGGRTPKEAKMKLRSKPIAPEWLPVVNFHLRPMAPAAWLAFLR